MSTSIKALTLAVIAAAFSSVNVSHADLVLDLVAVGPTTVNSGGTVDIQMLLRDTDGSDFGGVTGLGLFNGGGKLIESATTGASAAITATAVGADFGTTVAQGAAELTTPGLGGTLSTITIPAFPMLPVPAGIATGIAHIATYTVAVTGAAGSTVTVSSDTLGLSTVGGGLTVDGNVLFGVAPPDNNLDTILTSFAATPGNFDSVTLTVGAAAVPEASTLFCAALLACVGAVYVRRRNRAAAVEAAS